MSEQRPCQCEHISHFDKNEKSPNGNPNHRYGVKFFERYLVKVETAFGVFEVCKGCAEDCYQKGK